MSEHDCLSGDCGHVVWGASADDYARAKIDRLNAELAEAKAENERYSTAIKNHVEQYHLLAGACECAIASEAP